MPRVPDERPIAVDHRAGPRRPSRRPGTRGCTGASDRCTQLTSRTRFSSIASGDCREALLAQRPPPAEERQGGRDSQGPRNGGPHTRPWDGHSGRTIPALWGTRVSKKRRPGGRLLSTVTKCTKTSGLKMYQGQFSAHFRRGDSENVSEPATDSRPFVAGGDGAPHRPPEREASCCSLRP